MSKENIENTVLSLNGLHCAACVNRVEKGLKKIPGVINANVNLATQKAHIEFDKTKSTIDEMKNRIIDDGYEVLDIEEKKN